MPFLEISVATDDVLASLDFYRALGFEECTTGDTWTHPYAVVTDGMLSIGLHTTDWPAPRVALTIPDLQRVALGFTDSPGLVEMRIDPDTFNEVSMHDNDGHALWLLEARTFSPAATPAPSLLGQLLEVTLPVRDALAAAHFWGNWSNHSMAVVDEPRMHLRFDVGGLPLGLSEQAQGRALRVAYAVEALADLGVALSHMGHPMDPCGIGLEGCNGLVRSPEGLEFACFERDFLPAVAAKE